MTLRRRRLRSFHAIPSRHLPHQINGPQQARRTGGLTNSSKRENYTVRKRDPVSSHHFPTTNRFVMLERRETQALAHRLASHPTSGHPRSNATNQQVPPSSPWTQSELGTPNELSEPGETSKTSEHKSHERKPLNHGAHEAYLACRAIFSSPPSASMMQSAETPEEGSFYMAVAEFFLRQKQEELIKQGVF